MADIAIATRWWHAICMRCAATWGIWLSEPEDEPFCYEDGIYAMVMEGTLSTDPPGDHIKFLLRLPFQQGDERTHMGA